MRQRDGSWALRPIDDNSDGSNCLSSLSAGDSFSEISDTISEDSRSRRSRDGRPRRGPPSYTSDGSAMSNGTMSDIPRRPSRPVSTASSFARQTRQSRPSSRASEEQGAIGTALLPRQAQLSHAIAPNNVERAILRHAQRSNDYMEQNPGYQRRRSEYRDSRKINDYLGPQDIGQLGAAVPQLHHAGTLEMPSQSAASCTMGTPLAPEEAVMLQTPATAEVLPSPQCSQIENEALSHSADSCRAAPVAAATTQAPTTLAAATPEVATTKAQVTATATPVVVMAQAPAAAAALAACCTDTPTVAPTMQAPATAAVLKATSAPASRLAPPVLFSSSVCFPRALFGRLGRSTPLYTMLWSPWGVMERLGVTRSVPEL